MHPSGEVNRAIITGGNGDLARSIAAVLRASSWDVATPNRLELDVTDPEAVNRYFAGRAVDLLVCAAGISRDGLIATTDAATWDEVFEVNHHGAARCAAAVLPRMLAEAGGHIVFISSQSALHPPPGQVPYAASKASLIGLATALAREHGAAGIRVNVILPGFLETRMTAAVPEKRKRTVLGEHVLGRLNTPDAVGKFIRFLHEELPHTSGQVFQLDSRIS